MRFISVSTYDGHTYVINTDRLVAMNRVGQVTYIAMDGLSNMIGARETPAEILRQIAPRQFVEPGMDPLGGGKVREEVPDATQEESPVSPA